MCKISIVKGQRLFIETDIFSYRVELLYYFMCEQKILQVMNWYIVLFGLLEVLYRWCGLISIMYIYIVVRVL